MQNDKMQSVAGVLAHITLAAMGFVVVFVAYSFFDTSLARAAVLRPVSGLSLDDLGPGTVRLMMAFGLISIAVQLYILNAVRNLFRLYSSGIYLSEPNGHAITQIGIGLIALPIVRFVLEPIWTILVTQQLEEQSASISVSSTGIGLMLGGLLMLMIGRSIFEATRVRVENEAFV